MATTLLTARLDQLEASLPAVPARLVRLQRTIAGAAYDRTTAVVCAVAESTKSFLDTARISGKTVTGQARAAATDLAATAESNTRQVAGQARAAASDLAATAQSNTRQVTGQARAQGRRLSETAAAESTSLIDSAIDAVDPSPGTGTPYEQWTKAELMERARELDIDGRATMNKAQLVSALRRA